MIVITPTELRSNLSKYLNIAQKEKVVIKSKTEMFELQKKESTISQEELANALTGEELLARLKPRIKALFDK